VTVSPGFNPATVVEAFRSTVVEELTLTATREPLEVVTYACCHDVGHVPDVSFACALAIALKPLGPLAEPEPAASKLLREFDDDDD